jgi:pimeloyl-[acyl-carrier protein] methyl ester esterase
MKIYRETKGYGKDLVLIHGLGFHSDIWQGFAEQLKKEYRLTLIDLPGFGKSSAYEKPFNLADLAKAVLHVSPRKAYFLGWSLGGLVATYCAIYSPERVEAVINLCSSPCFSNKSDWPGISELALRNLAQGFAQDKENTLKRFLHFQSPNLSKTLLRELKQIIVKYPLNPQCLVSGLTVLEQTDLRAQLKLAPQRLLYILGQQDSLVPETITSYLSPLSSRIEIKVLNQAGHIPFITHPLETLTAIRNFCHG